MKAPWLDRSQQQLEQLMHATSAPVLLHGHQPQGLYNLVNDHIAYALCENKHNPHIPCGTCPACHMRLAGNHPDLRYLMSQANALELGFPVDIKASSKPSQHIRIDDVRELQTYFTTASSRGASRFVVVYTFDDLNNNTANALLKTLEEPPKGLRFVLLGNRIDNVLPTIRSRCQQLHIPMPSIQVCLHWLEAQGIKQADVALSLAMNNPFEALNLAQNAQDQLELRKKLVDWLSTPDQQASPPAGLEKISLPIQFELAMRLCSDCIAAAHAHPLASFPWLAPKLLWAKHIPLAHFSRVFSNLQTEYRMANHPINPRLVLEFIGQQWHTLSK